jgi:putative restriction endonuclease
VKLYVGITDYDWFKLHASKPIVEEVNFWKPSSQVGFRALQWGEPFLFKLKSPRNFVVGGGFFTKFVRLPLSLAWEAFGEGNGARSLEEFRFLISRNRAEPLRPEQDPFIGCIPLQEPFFFPDEDWIPIRFEPGIQTGRRFDMNDEDGRALWRHVTERLERAKVKTIGEATLAVQAAQKFGPPQEFRPRLGQGSFRGLLTDAYEYRCAMTAERTLPVLEAAHIRPYSKGGDHSLSNGLLLRSDLHKLFDLGYIAIKPDTLTIQVSRKIKEEFENGRDYYALQDRIIRPPHNLRAMPSLDELEFHNTLFKG